MTEQERSSAFAGRDEKGRGRTDTRWTRSLPRCAPASLLLIGCLAPPPPGPDAAAGLDAGLVDSAVDAGHTGFDAALPDLSLGLSAVGSDSTLELATWNLQSFPLAGDSSVDLIAGAIVDLQLDLIGVQEIMDMRDFQRLTTLLGDYQGMLSSDNLLRVGFLYRSSVLTASDQRELFVDDSYAFIRSPLQADFTATDPAGGGSYEFTAIVLHLKAGTETDDRDRRRAACEALKQYLDEQRAANPGRDYVVIGDFNDQLTDSGSYNVFTILLDASSTYRFLTLPLAESGEWSLPAYQIMIDHLLVADSGGADFAGDQTQVLRLDTQVTDYTTLISDHRPVVTIIEPGPW